MTWMSKRAFLGLSTAVAAALMLGGPAAAQETRRLAFITNGAADFWTIARRGTDQAQSELEGYEVEFIVPSESTAAEQRRIIDDLLARGVDGIAISPVNPENATDILNRAASEAVLFTTDSDAPQSDRVMYIGTDNVAAGRQAGELMMQAMPEGGTAILFVGSQDNANARERIEGIRSVLDGSNIEILDIRTDEFDFVRARRNVEDVLTSNPDIGMLVGLYAYNTPQIVEAVTAAGRQGEVKVVGFDEDVATLRGIADGIVFGTVVQQPYEFGYQSIKGLASVIEGDSSVAPENGLQIVPTQVINAENVAAFQETMREMLGQ